MSSVEFRQFKKILRDNGNFVTQPRMRLFGVLQHHSTLSIVQLIKHVPRHDRVTIYRNVQLFEKLGIITSLRIGNQTKLELSDKFHHHHHHMSCVNCRKVYVLKDSLVIEREIARVSNSSGFRATDHSLEIRGLCQTCQEQS